MDIEIHVIDSHTAGEPTRVVVEGGPPLTPASLSEQRSQFESDFDHFRSAIVTEPRGSEVVVGALLCQPHNEACHCGVIFFNNVGYLDMCGHGMIGVIETLRSMGKLTAGEHMIETPVGVVTVTLHESGEVSVENVESYRVAQAVEIEVEEIGKVVGDVAYGGNWFFLTGEPHFEISRSRVSKLTRTASSIRRAVNASGFPQVDHVELFSPPLAPESDSRNFVLCPGLEYDRSPCGTGTSAKLACLAANGTLAPETTWIQEGVLASTFRASYRWSDETRGRIRPTITGRAFVTADVRQRLIDNDPFRWGIPNDGAATE